LLLGDFVVHFRDWWRELDCLELGSGAGLTGILLARFAKTVILTDLPGEILENCETNVALNHEWLKRDGVPNILIRGLDWQQGQSSFSFSFFLSSFSPLLLHTHTSIDMYPQTVESKFDWLPEEIELLGKVGLFLAADGKTTFVKTHLHRAVI